ncbi:hypothetical protein E1H12_00155 [Geitlerinema sp. P-1104]|uniref:hypothetical protein n=1 Tax=Geitlerinema sp. P-1104 TaxID=2546230 RepID=UPI0011F8AC6C|nr:hypothetical protein [Geitlerinema sp. P-1104]NMG56964.1 hypothetical protein [Geitlerinema sp. P-1104]TAN86151.1 MAG: hypothetical protein EYR95_17190 [Phormidium sp. SL48-SHIP]
MTLKHLLTTLTLLGTSLASVGLTCPTNLPDDLAYQRRDNPSRCEGINRQSVSGSFSLVSFATSNVTSYDNPLQLRIPGVGSNPNLRVRSYQRRYQLDSLQLQRQQNRYQVDLNTRILRESHVPPNSLRALAQLPGSQPAYVPVIIGSPTNHYEIVFYSPSRVLIRSLEIRRNNQVVHRDSRPSPRQGEIRFTWDGRNQPAGDYQLRVEAEIQQRGIAPQSVTRVSRFHHDPSWLSQ